MNLYNMYNNLPSRTPRDRTLSYDWLYNTFNSIDLNNSVIFPLDLLNPGLDSVPVVSFDWSKEGF